MKKRLKMPKVSGEGCCSCCCTPCQAGENVIPEEDDFFTAPFNRNRMEIFDIDPNDTESFFTNAERSLIVKEVLDRTQFSPEGAAEIRFGVFKLLNEGVYMSAFPLHEGRYKRDEEDPTPFDGLDKDRARLYEAWARPGRWYCYQPLDLIRKYFGEKIAIYFAWLGFYTTMLIVPSILGVAAFIYGIVTVFTDLPVQEICNSTGTGSINMCPMCDKDCNFWTLDTSCFYSQISYVFDNYATVIFSAFMSIWCTCFLEFWKRRQKTLQYDWDVADFELEEVRARMRPEFEFKVKKRKENPITKIKEPYMPLYQKLPRTLTSLTVVLFMLALVIVAIIGVMVYRMVIVTVFYLVTDPSWVGSNATLFTSITAACINFVIIMVLNLVYKQLALFLTNIENHRTYTEYEDSFTMKMFLFQFINYYGSIFYIAFFKGRFLTYPGSNDYVIFDNFKQDSCSPAGCMVELTIQLFIVMVGKQILNNAKEIFLPGIKNWCRGKSQMKKETDSNLYMRWEQDHNLEKLQLLSLFDEYLEMVIQFGFITIFVAAFPLAPLFALINNIIEIRLDAFKFVTQFQRAPATKTQDIGAWSDILTGISFVAVLSNGAIIAFTSGFIPRMVYMLTVNPDEDLHGYVNSTLSVFRVSDYPADKKPLANSTEDYCRFKGYYSGPDSPEPYQYTTEYWIVFCARLGFLLVFEHVCFFLTWLMAFAIPDVPGSVKRLMLYERQLVRKTTYDAAFAEDREQAAHNNQF
ncbi:hypothetical protein CAPTEDRAFT_153860 [Capitella teleta]|uniref:Anoctamin n=1 Tax=Capitella teleta TaxID=283909 RepID=R7UV84_CAPTE|nr:hypothetical protein CAPTEDRAFT_153860 [Capitella teleta]|eukprot:ELU07316.1 hypothetical protein CAPTEDRAFT_153860 [Capitella teleta]